jgi:hypothetical protein
VWVIRLSPKPKQNQKKKKSGRRRDLFFQLLRTRLLWWWLFYKHSTASPPPPILRGREKRPNRHTFHPVGSRAQISQQQLIDTNQSPGIYKSQAAPNAQRDDGATATSQAI